MNGFEGRWIYGATNQYQATSYYFCWIRQSCEQWQEKRLRPRDGQRIYRFTSKGGHRPQGEPGSL